MLITHDSVVKDYSTYNIPTDNVLKYIYTE